MNVPDRQVPHDFDGADPELDAKIGTAFGLDAPPLTERDQRRVRKELRDREQRRRPAGFAAAWEDEQ